MVQSTASFLTTLEQPNQSRAAYPRSIKGAGPELTLIESRTERIDSTRYATADRSWRNVDTPTGPTPGHKHKTLYKLVDTQSGLLCQGGPWPGQWDATGKTWPSMAALRRYLRSVLARGYHLKPRPAPEHWHVIEIEQIISHREKSVLPANEAIASP